MVFMQSTRHSCQILMKLQFSQQIFRIILRYLEARDGAVG